METRSQSMLKEAMTHDAESSFGSRITVLEEKMEDQAEKLNHKLDQHIAEIFEAIRLILYLKGQTSANDDRKSDHPFLMSNSYESEKSRSCTSNHYSGRTRLVKLDFPRFSGDNMKE